MPKINVIWQGSQFINHSLALINREVCLRLIDDPNIDLTIVPYEKDTINNLKCELLKPYDVRYKVIEENNNKTIWICHQWPPHKGRPICDKWIIMQPWEYSLIPNDMANIFNKADEIWTPSNFCKRAFENSSVKTSIYVIPNGVDLSVFKPNKEYPKKQVLKTKKKLKLLYVGGTTYRKGIDILLKAYTETFSNEDDVSLIIKDIGVKTFYKGQNYSEQIKEIMNNSDMPEIEYLDLELCEHEMAELYNACDLFISPYRGEGFSLPTLEAMACNIPVIVTKGGPTDEFLNDEAGYYIPSKEKEIDAQVHILEPSIKFIKDILMAAMKNPKIYLAKTGGGKQALKYTWDIMAGKITERIVQIMR